MTSVATNPFSISLHYKNLGCFMLNKTIVKLSSLALALSISPSILAETNELITNGSFENFSISKDNGRWKLVQFDGWQGEGEVWTSRLGKAATDGKYKIELDVGREVNTLSQSVATIAGQKYHLSLDAYARRSRSSDFEILVDGEVIVSIQPDRKWQHYDAYFIGTGSTQTIAIKEIDAQSNGLGTIIDNVSLKASNELLSNGSFEEFTVTKNNGRWKLVTFKDWQGAGEVWTNRLGKRSTTGAYKIELDVGREVNSLSQSVSTEAGLYYQLSLDAYARRKNSSDFEIWLDNEKIETIKPSRNWKRYSVKLLGNGTMQTISIKEIDSQSNGLGTVIDNVSLISTGEYLNATPIISGTPATNISTGEAYSFLPTTTDADTDDSLVFSISNKPDWASFDPVTGELSGTPNNESITNNIVISVSDGTKAASLPAFAIQVKNPVNIAAKFGVVTQPPRNGYYYYSAPENVLDGNTNTYNHTQCTAGENWLQVALPSPTNISKIMIQGRASNTYRLQGATAYISSTPYTGTLNANDKVATLAGTAQRQETVFNTPKSGSYLIIKASGSNCLHLAEVEVYGEAPATPSFNTHEKNYLISGATAIGSTIASLSTTDYQGDTLSYRIIDDVPFSVNAQGKITASEVLQAGTYHIVVEVSDGTHSSQTTLNVQVTSSNAVLDAIKSGDISNVTAQELIQATLDEIEASKTFLLNAKVKIFNLDTDGSAKDDGSSLTSIDWNPSHDASLFSSTLGKNTPLLTTNAVEKTGRTIYNKEIAIIGEKGAGRYLVMGANPLRVTGNAQMDQVMENAMSWLTDRDDLKTAPFNITISHLDDSYWFRDESKTRQWLDTHYAGQVKYNAADACDAASLSSCLNNTDLLIISQQATNTDDLEAIAASVNQALQKGIPVLYIHLDGNQKPLGRELFSSVFDINYQWDNYWKNLSLQNYNPANEIGKISADVAKIKTLFQHIKNQDYSFDWSQCEGENCSNVAGLSTEFIQGATIVRNMMHAFDAKRKNIFNEEGYRLQKLLALTGDKFRQTIHFPMDKVTTNDTEFMKSYYADYAVYNSRAINPAQTDMGNFSRSNFSHITPTSRIVNLTTKNGFRSTGAYALPGQTVRVTRNDQSDVTVKVFINTLRSGSTHQWAKNGYNRPKFLQSQHMEIKSGETISFTSPYGGPLQLSFNKKDLPVSFNFQNIGEHAYWSNPADNASFAKKLADNEFDWAEVATAGFEVHSKLDKMIKSIASDKWGGTAEGLANAVVKYTSNYPHVLAGFKGEGVDIVPEIHDWAKAKGLTIETIDKMKHMNADQATCGYGCSGNPYDAYWAFNPIGHGDIHEMGHSLQKKRFEGFPNHAATNTFSYYTKSRYFDNTGGDNDCGGLPFKTLFNTIQSAVGKTDVAAYLKTNLWDKAGLGEQYLLKIQAMMHAQKMGKLENGWHVLARVHILEREMRRAKQDWEKRKESVGFSNYTLNEIKSIGNNDWLVVAYSYAAGLDYRNYFDMMGIPYSSKARNQIASFGFDVVPNELFVSTSKGYCKQDEYGRLFDRPALAIDGKTTYPY
jgi:hypothetical protein